MSDPPEFKVSNFLNDLNSSFDMQNFKTDNKEHLGVPRASALAKKKGLADSRKEKLDELLGKSSSSSDSEKTSDSHE